MSAGCYDSGMFGPDFSLQFRVFGIPVHLSLFFLLLVVLIGRNGADGSPVLLAAWVLIAFASVLAHELGHALSVRAFGGQPFIMLYGLGGVTTWRRRGELTAGRRFLISAAGPAVGIVIGFSALVPWVLLKDEQSMRAAVVGYVLW